MVAYNETRTCARDDCFEEHLFDRWNAIRAVDAGWFMSRASDKVYCPEHVPDWVAGWRARNKGSSTDRR